jgi:hypothetical protein
MKACLKTGFLIMLAAFAVVLSACNAPATTKTITTTKTAAPATTTVTETTTLTLTDADKEKVLLADEGTIRINGVGHFRFQRVAQPISEPIVLEGVTFTPGEPEPGQTITVPVMYWLIAEFEDGTKEQLRFAGFPYSDLDFSLTEHDNPRAGVLMTQVTRDNAQQTIIYLMVSTD